MQVFASITRFFAAVLQRSSTDPRSILAQLRKTPYAQLDDTVRRLVRQCGAEQVRQAMVELIKEVPIQDFRVLKRVFFKHFAV